MHPHYVLVEEYNKSDFCGKVSNYMEQGYEPIADFQCVVTNECTIRYIQALVYRGDKKK